MPRRYQATLLNCDFCGREVSEDAAVGWVGVTREGATKMSSPLAEDRTFCSMQDAALYLLRAAMVSEVLGPEAMKLTRAWAADDPNTEDVSDG